MNFGSLRTLLTSGLAITVVLLLCASFTLHSVQVPHAHHGHTGVQAHDEEGESSPEFSLLGEYLHAAEKKLFLLIVSVWELSIVPPTFLVVSWIASLFFFASIVALLLQSVHLKKYVSRLLMQILFARGILHPKPY